MSGLYKWLFYLANCEATQPRRFQNYQLEMRRGAVNLPPRSAAPPQPPPPRSKRMIIIIFTGFHQYSSESKVRSTFCPCSSKPSLMQETMVSLYSSRWRSFIVSRKSPQHNASSNHMSAFLLRGIAGSPAICPEYVELFIAPDSLESVHRHRGHLLNFRCGKVVSMFHQ